MPVSTVSLLNVTDPKVAIRGLSVLPQSIFAMCRLSGPDRRMILIAPRPGAVAEATMVSEGIMKVDDGREGMAEEMEQIRHLQ